VGNQNPRSEFADGPGGLPARDAGADPAVRVLATPEVAGVPPRELANASSRAIALDASRVYFGDAEDDDVYAVPKAGGGGEPVKVGRRAPVPEALSVDGSTLAWVGTPGDVVLRAPSSGGPATTLKDRGLFTGVVANGGDVFFVEADRGDSVVSRLATSGTSASRIASFDGLPRGMTADASRIYVATSTGLVATPRTRGDAHVLAAGSSFSHPVTDDTMVYATIPSGQGRARLLVRVPKTGGAPETVATNVRDAPIACFRGSLYWFDADRAALLASPPGSASVPRTVSETPLLAEPSALAVDADGAFVAAGFAEEGRILAIAFAK
jgi:hypothetical protein